MASMTEEFIDLRPFVNAPKWVIALRFQIEEYKNRDDRFKLDLANSFLTLAGILLSDVAERSSAGEAMNHLEKAEKLLAPKVLKL